MIVKNYGMMSLNILLAVLWIAYYLVPKFEECWEKKGHEPKNQVKHKDVNVMNFDLDDDPNKFA